MSSVLAAYEALLGISEQMVAAARAGEWDELTSLEARSRAIVQGLPAQPGAAPGAERRRQIEIIHRVLANDAEVRRLAEPRMAELEALLGSLKRGKAVSRAYSERAGD